MGCLEAMVHNNTLYRDWSANKSRKYVPRLTGVVLFECEASLVITGPVDVVPESADVGLVPQDPLGDYCQSSMAHNTASIF